MNKSTTINERFVKLIEALNKNPNSFSKSIGKTYTAVESICKGRTKPGFELLESILDVYPQVNSDWLIKGEGDMFRKDEVNNDSNRQDQYLQDYMTRLEERFIKMIEARDQQIISLTRMLEKALGKPEVVLAYAASCTFFLLILGTTLGTTF